MKDKLKSKVFINSLGNLSLFIEKEIKNLRELKERDIEAYRSRVRELSSYGFNTHTSQFTYEVMGISFGFN